MTIKVLSRGTPERDKTYRTSCRECASDFTFQKSDCTIGSDRNETYYNITCPVCKYEVFLSHLKEHRTR